MHKKRWVMCFFMYVDNLILTVCCIMGISHIFAAFEYLAAGDTCK